MFGDLFNDDFDQVEVKWAPVIDQFNGPITERSASRFILYDFVHYLNIVEAYVYDEMKGEQIIEKFKGIHNHNTDNFKIYKGKIIHLNL